MTAQQQESDHALFQFCNEYEFKDPQDVTGIEAVFQRYPLPNIDSFYKGNRLTSLHVASKRGWTGLVKFLLLKGANPRLVGLDEETPLHKAVRANHHDIVKLLVQADSASIGDQNENGMTALHLAAEVTNDVDKVKYLLDQGLQYIHLKQKEGYTAAHVACIRRNYETMRVILEKDLEGLGIGSSPPIPDEEYEFYQTMFHPGQSAPSETYGETCLHLAVGYFDSDNNRGYDKAIEWLLSVMSDCDIQRKCSDGRTAWDMLCERKLTLGVIIAQSYFAEKQKPLRFTLRKMNCGHRMYELIRNEVSCILRIVLSDMLI